MQHIETIQSSGRTLAIIVRHGFQPNETTFVTEESMTQQVGFIVYQAGGEVPRHTHRRIERHLDNTAEVIIVRKGACEIDFYTDNQEPVATARAEAGDCIVLVAGDHGFRMIEDTVLLEVKQGPYPGCDEKVRF